MKTFFFKGSEYVIAWHILLPLLLIVFVVGVAFGLFNSASAQLLDAGYSTQILDAEFSTSTLTLYSSDLLKSFDVPKALYTEELPVGYDLKRFYDTDLNNVCYLYREQSISCVKL